MQEKIILDMDATFGKIVFLGAKKDVYEGYGRTRQKVGVGYACYSEKQRSMFVILPPDVTPKVTHEVEVKLIEPYMTFAHSGSRDDSSSERMLYAQDIKLAK